jgi:antitoxin MazE
MVTQKVSSWGNSLGVRLPRAIVQQVGWKEGIILKISIENGNVILSPARQRYTLDELIKDVDPEKQHPELEWGEAAGQETW